MSHDNVTPFRKRRPPPKQARQGPPLSTHRGKAVAVQLLALLVGVCDLWPLGAIYLGLWAPPPMLLSLLGLAAAIAGFFIAMSNRQGAMPWAATHHEFALRSIIVAVCASMLGSVLGFVMFLGMLGLALSILGAIWIVVRSGYGLVRAALRLPMLRPTGWLL